ncbi:hypothetical protein DFP72DRAFT_88360 [Ephemerocybe angulata]|uniref:Uncharacterized protein n=1 Tax=Ephemerocybe angulata TaxID=980116 RepID=A0A8H6HDD0_9AGAR|nr:hypothetical protein DFP72DRAFT_88360 [Tulosesus angulatus]
MKSLGARSADCLGSVHLYLDDRVDFTSPFDVLILSSLFPSFRSFVSSLVRLAIFCSGVLACVRSGARLGVRVCVCSSHRACIIDEIPFGGVDESGYGKQPLKYTFEEFVCLRSVLEVRLTLTFGGRYPPSSKETLELLEGCSKVRIPTVEELGGKVNGANGVNGALTL